MPGNVCRSPIAEFVFKDMVSRQGHRRNRQSVHHGTRKKFTEYGISTAGKYAVQLKKSDYEKYDYIIGMESLNIRNIMRIIGQDNEGKVTRLLDFEDTPKDIADPWYTGNFDETYDDVRKGCEALLKHILSKTSHQAV